MSLTRKLLKELGLNDTGIERVITAHTEVVDALKRERDKAQSALSELDTIKADRDSYQQQSTAHEEAFHAVTAEYAAYRRQVDDHLHRENRRRTLMDALRRFGANEHAIDLMADALALPPEAWNGDELKDEGAVLNRAKEAWGPLFAVSRSMPTTRCAPPVTGGGALTADDLRRMSPTEINRNWTAVQTALKK